VSDNKKDQKKFVKKPFRPWNFEELTNRTANQNEVQESPEAIWNSDFTLDFLNARGKRTLAEQLAIEFTAIGNDYLVAKMPVDERTTQPLGRLHGGASCALAETVGSVAANCCVDNQKYVCVGLEINANHIKAATEGFVYAKATPIHLGKTTQIWNIAIEKEEGTLVCISRLTMAILEK